jgi:hypothetical protein
VTDGWLDQVIGKGVRTSASWCDVATSRRGLNKVRYSGTEKRSHAA